LAVLGKEYDRKRERLELLEQLGCARLKRALALGDRFVPLHATYDAVGLDRQELFQSARHTVGFQRPDFLKPASPSAPPKSSWAAKAEVLGLRLQPDGQQRRRSPRRTGKVRRHDADGRARHTDKRVSRTSTKCAASFSG
jgi:hypothetical protein